MVKEEIVVDLAVKGVDKVRSDFNRLNKGFADLSKMGTQAQVAFNRMGKEISNSFSIGGKAQPKSSPLQNMSSKEMSSMQDNFVIAQKAMSTASANFGQVMTMPLERLAKFNKQGLRFNNMGGRFANKIRMMTHGLKGFRMELLGVLFFGMAMANMFGNMLRPAAQVFGIFDLWTVTLQTLFLPIMSMITPLLFSFMTWLMELSPAGKNIIGVIAILGVIIGKLLFVLATLGLGFGSVFQLKAIGAVSSFFKFFVKGFGLIFNFLRSVMFNMGLIVKVTFRIIISIFSTVFGWVLLIIVGFVLAWKTNFSKIKDWVTVIFEGIKLIIKGVLNVIIGIFDVVVGIFTGNFTKIKLGWQKLWLGMGQTAKGLAGVIAGVLVTIGLSIVRVIVGIINSAIKLINYIPGVNISTISTGATRGLEKDIKGNTQASAITINQTITADLNTKEDIERMMDENNKKLQDDVKMFTATD